MLSGWSVFYFELLQYSCQVVKKQVESQVGVWMFKERASRHVQELDKAVAYGTVETRSLQTLYASFSPQDIHFCMNFLCSSESTFCVLQVQRPPQAGGQYPRVPHFQGQYR